MYLVTLFLYDINDKEALVHISVYKNSEAILMKKTVMIFRLIEQSLLRIHIFGVCLMKMQPKDCTPKHTKQWRQRPLTDVRLMYVADILV